MTEEETIQALLKKLSAIQQARGALAPSSDETLDAKDVIVRQIRAQAPSSELVGGSADAARRKPKTRIDLDPSDPVVTADRNRDDAIVVIDVPTTSPR